MSSSEPRARDAVDARRHSVRTLVGAAGWSLLVVGFAGTAEMLARLTVDSMPLGRSWELPETLSLIMVWVAATMGGSLLFLAGFLLVRSLDNAFRGVRRALVVAVGGVSLVVLPEALGGFPRGAYCSLVSLGVVTLSVMMWLTQSSRARAVVEETTLPPSIAELRRNEPTEP